MSRQYDCPVDYTISLLSSKWNVLILNELRESEKRPSQLLTRLAPISQKVLTTSLKNMEEAGLILRIVLQDKPIKVEYSLTNKGDSLVSILDSICDWEKEYRLPVNPHS